MSASLSLETYEAAFWLLVFAGGIACLGYWLGALLSRTHTYPCAILHSDPPPPTVVSSVVRDTVAEVAASTPRLEPYADQAKAIADMLRSEAQAGFPRDAYASVAYDFTPTMVASLLRQLEDIRQLDDEWMRRGTPSPNYGGTTAGAKPLIAPADPERSGPERRIILHDQEEK